MNGFNTSIAKTLAPPSVVQKPNALEVFDGLDLSQWKDSLSSGAGFSRKRGRRVRMQEIAEFTSQLAIMVRSGIDAATALGSLASQTQKVVLANVLTDVHRAVMAGSTLSEALKPHPLVFDAAYVATVAAGEMSGSLSDVLSQLAKMQRNELRNRRTMRTLMTYPILLLAVCTSVIAGLVIFVLPRFAGIFEQYDVALPMITQMLLNVAGELRSRWWLWGPLAVVLIVGGIGWRGTATGRRTLDAMCVNIAFLGDAIRSKITGRICRLLGLMLDNGVPIMESLHLTRNAIDNTLYRDLLADLEEAVLNGRNLASVLQGTKIVPQSARDMLITAESTGNISEVTILLGEYYEEDAEARMRQIVGFIEPALTVGMGVLVAIVVLAVMLPVFDLSSVAQGGH